LKNVGSSVYVTYGKQISNKKKIRTTVSTSINTGYKKLIPTLATIL
jgi:hypothetical protein